LFLDFSADNDEISESPALQMQSITQQTATNERDHHEVKMTDLQQILVDDNLDWIVENDLNISSSSNGADDKADDEEYYRNISIVRTS
jgi:hypothetical protein